MLRIKLICSCIVLLILSFGFSSYFALTALAKLYEEFLHANGSSAGIDLIDISAFLGQQLSIGLLVLLVGIAALLLVIIYRLPAAPSEWGLKKAGWWLVLVSMPTQILALGLYATNFIEVVPLQELMAVGLTDVIIEIITILLIATLLFVELIILMLTVFQTENVPKDQLISAKVDPRYIRPAMFLFLFGVDLSSAFIPLHMENLAQPLLGLPKDVVMGLPISAMFFCVSITIVIAGIWLDRRGWHEPFLVGMSIAVCAKIYAWQAPSAIHFIAAMGLVGLGYGLTLMASQGFIIAHADDSNKARGFAYVAAGTYAGGICGTAAGAMLAERIGYASVFMLSAVMVFLALGYTLSALRTAIGQSKLHSSSEAQKRSVSAVTWWHYWQFLSNRYVLALVFLSSLPSAIAVIGFLNFFGPVYLNRHGYSDSTIGAVLIIYGICMVYLGPMISKYIDASDDKRYFVIIGCVIGGCAFLPFYVLSGFIATVIAVFLLGVSSCFVLASQTTYALTLDVTKQLGQGRAIGIFRASSRIGQMLGPMLFGTLIVATDINVGVGYFGIAYLITAALFVLMTRKRSIQRNAAVYETNTSN